MYDMTTQSGAKFLEERARESIQELSESAKNRARAYCKRMNSLYGYPLYVVDDVPSKPLKFGEGTLGIPQQILAFLLLFFIPVLLNVSGGVPLPVAIFIGLTVHVLLLSTSAYFCKKYRDEDIGAARGAKLAAFFLQDFTLTLTIGLIIAGLVAAVLPSILPDAIDTGQRIRF